MPLGSSPIVNGPAGQSISPEPSSAVHVAPAPVEIKGDDAAVTQSALSQQIQASESLRQSPSSQVPVPGDGVNPVPLGPNRNVQPPAPLSTSDASPSLHAQPSPISVSQVALPSLPHNVVTPPSVTVLSEPASPNVMPHGQDPHILSPSLAPSGHAGVAQVSQAPPSPVPVPVHTPPPMAPVPQSPAAQHPKPPPRRQSHGLNFLQVDLQHAREKKKAAALAAGQQKSGSPARACPALVPTAIAPTTVTASPTSTATAGPSNVSAGPMSISTAFATAEVAPTRTPPLTGTTPVHTPTTSTPTIVHRDLRQGGTRSAPSSASPCKLRITDRAPAPAPEPGSSSAPIVIDEDDDPIRRPADESIEIDSPTETLPTPLTTATASDPQGVQGDTADTGNGHIPQPEHDEVGKTVPTQLSLTNTSVLQVTPRPPLVSEHGPPVTGTLRADVKVEQSQSPSIPSLFGPRASITTPPPATPSSGPSVPPGSENEVRLQQAKVYEEQGKVVDVSVESLGHPIEVVSGVTIEPLLGSESSAINVGSAGTVEDTEMIPPAPAVTETTVAVTESSATLAVSHDGAEQPSSQSNIAESHNTGEHATPSVTEASPAIGKHRRSLTPDGETRRVLPRKEPVSEIQQDAPTIVLQSDIVESTSSATVAPGSEQREKEVSSEIAADHSFQLGQMGSQTLSFSSGKASEPMLAVPSSSMQPSTESLSDMDISYSITPPPIVVLGTRTGASTPDSHSRSSSVPSGNVPSESGIDTVKAEELEDEMVDELAPLFGKEMRVICMDRAWDVPGEFTWNFHLPQVDWDRVSQWANAPENLECVGS